MPRFRVTMRDGKVVEVEAADKDHARGLAARKVGTSWPGVKAEAVSSKTKCMMRGESRGGETRYCQFDSGHRGEHSYANEGT